ncbi:MAG: DUF998 domain-containing protein [Methanomassiliicoccaceae archaeon]|nr:DUF998 domain-containing protein [Methanomassiliicoccaceae archaeon]
MKVSKDHGTAFAWLGVTGVAVFVFSWLCAASADSAWQFGVNTLSELGVSDTDASCYFNLGCCAVTGILIAALGCGRTIYSKNAGHIACGVLLAFGGILLVLVGVFTMDTDEHKVIAVSAALFLFMGIIAATAGNWVADRKIFAGAGIVIIFMLVAMFFAYDTAEFEAYGIILAMVWFLLESVNMILSGKKN